MKKLKIMTINFELKFDTLYVFHLNRNYSYQVFAKNVSFKIRTNQFGLAMYCFDVNKIRKTDEYNLLRFSVITDDRKSVSINVFDKLMQERITSFILRKIKKATDKKKARKEKIRSFASQIARRLDKTKRRLIDLLKIDRFSYREFEQISSKKFNKILSDLTMNIDDYKYLNVSMKKSIIFLLNQSNSTRATA